MSVYMSKRVGAFLKGQQETGFAGKGRGNAVFAVVAFLIVLVIVFMKTMYCLG